MDKEVRRGWGTAIICGDGNIRQNPVDLIAYIESGLIGFWVPPRYDDLKGYGQAALILRWFPTIVEKIKACSRSECWQIPFLWTPDMNGFKNLKDPREHPSAGAANPPIPLHQFRRLG